MDTLHHFIVANRAELISLARGKGSARPRLSAPADDLGHGVPLFLSQLSESLRRETSAIPYPDSAIGVTAAKHGRATCWRRDTPSHRSSTTTVTSARRSRSSPSRTGRRSARRSSTP